MDPQEQADLPAMRVRRLMEEVCNGRNLAVLHELVGAATRDRLSRLLLDFWSAVPDAQWTIEHQLSQGDTVMTRLSISGTFSGSLLGLARPGRFATLSGVAIGRFDRGCLEELWVQADLLGLLQQLGVLPSLDLAQAVTMAQVLRAGNSCVGAVIGPGRAGNAQPQPSSSVQAPPGTSVPPVVRGEPPMN